MKSIFSILLISSLGFVHTTNAWETNGARISLGKTFLNSELKIAEVGYEYNQWELNASLTENGETVYGYQEQMTSYSISYITKIDRFLHESHKSRKTFKNSIEPFFRIGITKNSDSTLMGNSNFKLGLGIDIGELFQIEYIHISSAGIHDVNLGLDYVKFTYKIPGFK